MLNCIFRFLLSSLLFGGKKIRQTVLETSSECVHLNPSLIACLLKMMSITDKVDSNYIGNQLLIGRPTLAQLAKALFFCPQLLPTGYLWQFTSAAIYVAVCYYFVALHLFSAVRTSHHCQRFCRVINLSTEDKNRWVVLFLFQRALSILYSWGRQTQINSWSGEKKGTKPDKNGG